MIDPSTQTILQHARYREVHLGPVDISLVRRPDGCMLLTSRQPLLNYPKKITERIVHWARNAPNRIAFAERDTTGSAWKTLTYTNLLASMRNVAQALIDRGLSEKRPVMILSENDLENAILHMAAMHVGVPYVPVSPNYSLLSNDFGKLRSIAERVRPGLVFASCWQRYGKALESAFPEGTEFVVTRNAPSIHVAGKCVNQFADLIATVATSEVEERFDAVGPDTVAKIVFTSGSTGAPKGAIITQRHLCSNAQQSSQIFPFLQEAPPVMVDWLPWHHIFGGTGNIGMMIYEGGSYYIDPGKPFPEEIEHTVRALREIAPVYYANVPKGFDLLIPYLDKDEELRRNFFSRLQLIVYGAAALPAHLWDALDELSVRTRGERVLISAGLGSTECGPMALFAWWAPPKPRPVSGLPLPGVEVKLVPAATKLEIRLRGPCITRGYWKDEELTRAAFDEEGFFRLGDAVKFVDEDHPEKGLVFDGRIVEDFKLTSGSWVSVSALRSRMLNSFAPYVQDVVIAGHNRDYLSVIVFPLMEECRRLAELADSASANAVCSSASVRDFFQERFDHLLSDSRGGTERVLRMIIETTPPTQASGELADKGTVSQRIVLEKRADVVAELYLPSPSARTLIARLG